MFLIVNSPAHRRERICGNIGKSGADLQNIAHDAAVVIW